MGAMLDPKTLSRAAPNFCTNSVVISTFSAAHSGVSREVAGRAAAVPSAAVIVLPLASLAPRACATASA